MFLVFLNLVSNLDTFYVKFDSHIKLHWIFSLE